MSYFVFVNFSDLFIMQCPAGRAVRVFAVAKLVKLICLTKFYTKFIKKITIYLIPAPSVEGGDDCVGFFGGEAGRYG